MRRRYTVIFSHHFVLWRVAKKIESDRAGTRDAKFANAHDKNPAAAPHEFHRDL